MEELTSTEIAIRLHKSERTIQRWIRMGKLKVTLLSNKRYAIDPGDIEALLTPPLDDILTHRLDTVNERLLVLEHQIGNLHTELRLILDLLQRPQPPQLSQPHQTPTTAKQPLSASAEPHRSVLKRGRPSTTTGARQPVPTHLPEGTMHIIDFANDLNLKKRSLLGYIQEHGIEHIAIPKKSREWEHDRYLTSEQQQQVRDLLEGHE